MAPSPATTLPPGPDLQAKLYETTERLAVALIERAEKDLTKAGVDGPSVRELQAVVEFAMNLLVKLPKLKPEDEDEDAGVEVLRLAMADPAKVVDRLQANAKFIAALRAKGWLPPAPRPNHRPTKEQVAERETYAARQADLGDETADDDDDSKLAMMLKGTAQ